MALSDLEQIRMIRTSAELIPMTEQTTTRQTSLVVTMAQAELDKQRIPFTNSKKTIEELRDRYYKVVHDIEVTSDLPKSMNLRFEYKRIATQQVVYHEESRQHVRYTGDPQVTQESQVLQKGTFVEWQTPTGIPSSRSRELRFEGVCN